MNPFSQVFTEFEGPQVMAFFAHGKSKHRGVVNDTARNLGVDQVESFRGVVKPGRVDQQLEGLLRPMHEVDFVALSKRLGMLSTLATWRKDSVTT